MPNFKILVHGSKEARNVFFVELLKKEFHKYIANLTEQDYLFSVTARGFAWDVYKFDTPKGRSELALRLDEGEQKVIVGSIIFGQKTEEEWIKELDHPDVDKVAK